MNKAVINRELKGYLADFVQDYIEEVLEDDNYDLNDYDDIFEDRKFQDFVSVDLEDKGFSPDEANQIVNRRLDNDTLAYKFLAYRFAIYNSYNSLEELKDIINNDSYYSKNVFTDEEIAKIFEQSQYIDY